MKIIRNVSILLFLLSVALFAYYRHRDLYEMDQTGPVFSVDSYLVKVSVKDDEKALLKGITAWDAADGDVSKSIIVESIGPFTGYGHRVVNYVAVDSDNHVAHTKRELVYTDYTPPRFHIKNPLSFPLNSGNVLQGVTAEDCLDGNITRKIRMVATSQIDTNYIGEHDVRLKVTNSAGSISYLPVSIRIYDEKVEMGWPQLNLTDYLVYLDKDSDFDPKDYMENLTIGARKYTFVEKGGTYGVEIESKMSKSRRKELQKVRTMDYDYVDITSDVDTSSEGFYRVKYFFHDDEDDEIGTSEVNMFVVVTDEKAEDKEDGHSEEQGSDSEQDEEDD